ncbi:Lsr2 family protein [Streptomyces olivoreticuli]
MAQKVITIYTDDLTGQESEDAATHTFSLDGVAYEIDLGPDSYEHMLEAMSPFIRAGRKTGKMKGQAPAKRRATTSGGDETAAIRQWARESGYTVNDRGRVPAEIREAYAKAH